ncbi:MAG: TlpA disulfide reductase family protein [Pirellulaceae bacterium]
MRCVKYWMLVFPCLFALTLDAPLSAQEDKAPKDKKEKAVEDVYTIPDGADPKALLAAIRKVQAVQPKSLEQFLKGVATMEKASALILKQVKDKKSAAYDVAVTTSLMTRLVRLQVPNGGDVDVKALFKDAEEFLTSKPDWTQEQVSIAAQLPQALEKVDVKLAGKAYAAMGKLMKKQKNPQYVEYGESLLGSGRRLNLVGNMMKVDGTTFAGKPFKLSELKGKVVLVDFWATWCGPCLREVPNMKKNFAKYHEKGFEIVGISIDEDRSSLDRFLQDNEVPWIILHEKGKANPVASYYGVNSIPFMVLIDKDGKVVSTEARGAELDDLLADLFAEK